MRQSIGEVATLNIIIIFIVIVFGLLAGTISYYKAFKVNSKILDSIEKYEGYNDLAKKQIENDLNTIGYVKNNTNWRCPNKNGGDDLVRAKLDDNTSQGTSHYYCIYYHRNDGSSVKGGNLDAGRINMDKEPIYYNYVVVTYIFVDLPIAGQFKVPVRTKGERTYNFSEHYGNPVSK